MSPIPNINLKQTLHSGSYRLWRQLWLFPIVIAIIAATNVGCGAPATGRIVGIVSQSGGYGNPGPYTFLTEAKIVITRQDVFDHTSYTTYSEIDGMYSIDLPPGKYELVASSISPNPGLLSIPGEATVIRNRTTIVNLDFVFP